MTNPAPHPAAMAPGPTASNDSAVMGIILAAGRGTRMGELTRSLPKPLVPVLGKPAVCWVIDGMISAGIRNIILVTGYLADQLRQALSGYRASELDISFVHQEHQRGTADAMLLTKEPARNRPVLLAYADIMTSPENFRAMVAAYTSGPCDFSAAIRDAGDPWRAAAVYLDNDLRIRQIIEKPPMGTSTTPWSHAGMYCFSPAIYDYAARVVPSARGELEITDAVAMMLSDGKVGRAVELAGYWKDLATPADIAEAESMMQLVPANRKG